MTQWERFPTGRAPASWHLSLGPQRVSRGGQQAARGRTSVQSETRHFTCCSTSGPVRDTTLHLLQYRWSSQRHDTSLAVVPLVQSETPHITCCSTAGPVRDTTLHLLQYLWSSQRHHTSLAAVPPVQSETRHFTCCSTSGPVRDTTLHLLQYLWSIQRHTLHLL